MQIIRFFIFCNGEGIGKRIASNCPNLKTAYNLIKKDCYKFTEGKYQPQKPQKKMVKVKTYDNTAKAYIKAKISQYHIVTDCQAIYYTIE